MHMTYEQNSTQGPGSSFGNGRSGSGAADEVRRQTREKFEGGREHAASELDSFASAAGAAAEDLRDHHQEGLSRYVGEIAESVSSIANSLRHKSVDELVHDAESIARKNPTLFLAGSLAVGLGIGRFARASSKNRSSQDSKDESWADSDKDYPRNLSGDAYPEQAGNDDIQHVTEEDYLADDYAFAGGEDIENDDSLWSNQPASNSEVTTKKTRPDDSGNRNPIGGDFYE